MTLTTGEIQTRSRKQIKPRTWRLWKRKGSLQSLALPYRWRAMLRKTRGRRRWLRRSKQEKSCECSCKKKTYT